MVHDNGTVFHGLAHQRLVFSDAESIRATRDAAGQVLGQFRTVHLHLLSVRFRTVHLHLLVVHGAELLEDVVVLTA